MLRHCPCNCILDLKQKNISRAWRYIIPTEEDPANINTSKYSRHALNGEVNTTYLVLLLQQEKISVYNMQVRHGFLHRTAQCACCQNQ